MTTYVKPRTLSDYTTVSEEDASGETRELAKLKAPSTFFSLGPNQQALLRILPAAPGGQVFQRFYKHFYDDPITGAMISYACPKHGANRPCTSCFGQAKLQAASAKAGQKKNPIAWDMAAKMRVVANVYVYWIEGVNGTGERVPVDRVQVWEFGSGSKGKSVHERLLSLRVNRETGGDYSDPSENGYNLLVSKTGEGGQYDTTWTVSMARKPSPLATSEEEALEILDLSHDLEAIATPPDAETMALAHAGEQQGRGGQRAVGQGGQRAVGQGGGDSYRRGAPPRPAPEDVRPVGGYGGGRQRAGDMIHRDPVPEPAYDPSEYTPGEYTGDGEEDIPF